MYKGKQWEKLAKEMEKLQSLPLVAMDEIVHRACVINNDKKIMMEKEVPMPGGNLEELKVLLRGDRVQEAEEFTMVQWDGTALQLIILNLLNEFD